MSKKPGSDWRSSIEKILEQQQGWQEQINKMLKPQLPWQNQLEKLVESQRKWQEQIDQILEPQRLWQHRINLLLEPQRRWQEQIKNLIEPERQWQGLVEKYFSNFNPNDINIDPSGTVTIGDNAFSSDELTAELDLLSQDLSTAGSFQDYLGRLSIFLERLRPPLAKILVLILLPYVIAIFADLTTPVYENWWQNLSGKTKQESAKGIREEALSSYDSKQLSEHRFVLASRLRVQPPAALNLKLLMNCPWEKL